MGWRTWPETVSYNRQKVMEELVQGREMANQLRSVLSGDVRSAEGLVTKILGSFTNTLLILNGSQQAEEEELTSYEVQANISDFSTAITASGSGSGSGSATATATAGADSSSWDVFHDDAMKSEDSNEEICNSTETFKDLRGSYKRRKTSRSWIKDTLDLVDDGHAWRKYGQKMILSTRHPRNYFRCTHKFDQGCKATKHVQKIQDEPQLFRTTYYGNHTCTDCLRAPHELILDCSSREESSQNIIRFDDTNKVVKEEHPFSSAFTSIKKESVKEEEMIKPVSDHDQEEDQMIKPLSDHDQVTHHNQSPSSCDNLMSPVLGMFESSGPINELSSTIPYDHDDLISSILVGYCDDFDNEADFRFQF